jgi:hypothetical protein
VLNVSFSTFQRERPPRISRSARTRSSRNCREFLASAYRKGHARSIPGVCTKKGDGHQKYRTAWDQAQLRIIREIVQRRDEYRQSWEGIAVAFLRLGYRDELGIPWGGVPENGGRPLKHSKDRPRTKKIRRAYKWWRQAAAEGELPLIE